MPTILKVYSSNMSNPIICSVINFACRQFLLLHRNPFVLQVTVTVSLAASLYSTDEPHMHSAKDG